MKNRKSTKHSQVVSPRKVKEPTPSGEGFLKPRKPPSGPLSTPHHAAERDGPEWGGEEEAHLDDAQERATMSEAARNATSDKIQAEEEAKKDKENEEDDENEDDEDEDEVGTPKEAEAEQVTPAGPQMVTSADRFVDYMVRLNEGRVEAMNRGLVGVSTGLPRLDLATGGLEQITLIAGQTETGKTSLATQVCLAGLRSDPKLAVVYYLMDAMTEKELFDQMVCRETGIDHEKYVGKKLSEEEKNKCNSARDRRHAGRRRAADGREEVQQGGGEDGEGERAGQEVTGHRACRVGRELRPFRPAGPSSPGGTGPFFLGKCCHRLLAGWQDRLFDPAMTQVVFGK